MSKIIMYRDKHGRYRWEVREADHPAPDPEVLLTSPKSYFTKDECLQDILLVIRTLVTSPVEDISGNPT